MIAFIEYLGLPMTIGIIIVALLLVMNLIGEILEFKGKVVPECVKFRKVFTRHKEDRKTMQELKTLLSDVNSHYSEDNIAKRNSWMKWVNDRADVYDDSISSINSTLADVANALKDNTKMTEEIFVQQSRDRIIDFAGRAANGNVAVSREEFNRIFKVYEKYERFLEERELTNGEVDIAMQIINESYKEHIRAHNFIEDVRGL